MTIWQLKLIKCSFLHGVRSFCVLTTIKHEFYVMNNDNMLNFFGPNDRGPIRD